MNVVFCLFVIKNVLGQDWNSKQEIDYPYLYQKEFDRTDGLQLNRDVNLTSHTKNETDEEYLEQVDETNYINVNGPFNDLNDLDTNDEEDIIERPCKVFDKNCIRRYFAAHSHCTAKYQPVADPVYRPQSTFYLTRVNVTVTPVDVYYTGLTGRIIEFFINKKTNRLVLAFTFDNFTTSSDNTYFRFNRRAREPVVTRSSIRVLYFSITATVIIPNLSNLRLDKSEIFFSSDIPGDILIVNPSIFGNGDPFVAAALVDFLLRRDVNVQEAFLLDANYYANTFIQQSICDFGLIQS